MIAGSIAQRLQGVPRGWGELYRAGLVTFTQ